MLCCPITHIMWYYFGLTYLQTFNNSGDVTFELKGLEAEGPFFELSPSVRIKRPITSQ